MSENDDFAARLARIKASRSPDDAPMPRAGQARAGGAGVTGVLLLGGLVAAGVAGAALYLDANAARTAALEGVGVSADEGDSRPALLQAIARVLSPFPTETPASDEPVFLLPPPPAGWVRVTQPDAQGADPMAEVRARWQAAQADGPPLTDTATQALQDFLDRHANPDLEAQVRARKRADALYLGPDGAFLNLRLSLLDEAQALGDEGKAATWQDEIADRAEARLMTGRIVERLTLGGYRAVNVAPDTGRSLVARPIDGDLESPNGVRLTIALDRRATLEIEGLATPRQAEALTKAVDHAAVLDRLAAR